VKAGSCYLLLRPGKQRRPLLMNAEAVGAGILRVDVAEVLQSYLRFL
jgi:hypothetical protein